MNMKKLTEFTSLDDIAWIDFSGTNSSSAPSTTKIGTSSTDCSKEAAFCGEKTVAFDNRPIS